MANILVIEDSAHSRSMARLALRDEAHELIEAMDGVDGVRAAVAHHPDVIVLSLQLPALDGIDVMRRLRESGSSTPFIVLSEPVTEETRETCALLGTIAVLERPLEGAALRDAIRRSLERRGPTVA